MEAITLSDGYARVAAGAFESFAGFMEACVGLREAGEARCMVIDLTGERAPEGSPAELEAFAGLALPTIAAVAGVAAGAKLDLAAACDIRVSDEATVFRLHESARLSLLLRGPGAATETGAAGALEPGLVSEVAPSGRSMEAAERIAGVVASRGPLAVQLGKEAIWRGLEMPLGQGLRFELDLTLLLQTTKDRAEGVAAFLEKREPRFTGE